MTPPFTLWEVFKAFIRGRIISFEASRGNEHRSKLKEFENQIKSLHKENAQSPSTTQHRKTVTMKYECNKIILEKVGKAFLYVKLRHFEFGDKLVTSSTTQKNRR